MSIKHLKTNRSKKYKEAIKQVDLLHGVHNRLQLQLSIQSQASTPPQPEEEKKIISWLSKLKLLYGIPFEYLVIDEGMLPVESIKFFYLDRNWVTALVDGAYSIGRATEGDEAHDTIFSSKVDLHSHISSHRLRGNAFGKESVNNPTPLITGFLLRSSAVTQWPGLEVNGYEDSPATDNSNELTILRMDHISPDIILCLFAGVVNYLRIHAPPEALHFGFNSDHKAGEDYKKSLRNENGEPFSGGPIDINNDCYRNQNKEKSGILRIASLANKIQQSLKMEKQITSAGFALQMVSGVDTPELDKK